MKQVEKPPVLIEEQIQQIFNGIPRKNLQMNWLIAASRVQRDADAEWYEKKYLISDYEWNIQQAKAKVAREILNKMMCIRHEGHFGKPYDMYELNPSDYYAFESKYQEGK